MPGPQRLVVFVHIPKAAGTTLVSIIEQEYRPRSIYRFRHAHTIEEQVEEINRAAADRKGYEIVTGHLGYGLHGLVEQPVSYFTMLREPLALLISRYHYRRNHPGQHPVLAQHAKRSSLLEFGRSIEDNTMTRFLSGAEFEAQASLGPGAASFQRLQIARVTGEGFQGDPACTPEMLKTAKANLRDRIDAFGIAERFDVSLVLMSHVFGWKKINYVRQNIGERKARRDPVSRDDMDALRARNAFDVELYAHACELFEERIQALEPGFRNQVDRFRSMNAIHGRLNLWQTRIARSPQSTVKWLRRAKRKVLS